MGFLDGLRWKSNNKKVKVQGWKAWNDKRYKPGKNDVKGDGSAFYEFAADVINSFLKTRK
ncbi:hypothetical protein DR871_003880 [Flavobacterium petrolei]|uniref:Uncharacterized protein n=1 Tax=Flavobacterium petrolei TaxID=2259594 RepID=A0A482U073_9FLAO|nr:hypothetical protein [Flavobacterium petrolei]RYJ53196.1 hypothetical protein DR871_003880 [Flavobacterium petrolei]